VLPVVLCGLFFAAFAAYAINPEPSGFVRSLRISLKISWYLRIALLDAPLFQNIVAQL